MIPSINLEFPSVILLLVPIPLKAEVWESLRDFTLLLILIGDFNIVKELHFLIKKQCGLKNTKHELMNIT